MTGPEPAVEPGSNEELPEDDTRDDAEIEAEGRGIYERMGDPLGADSATIRAATERAQVAALGAANAMDRIADAQRTIGRMETDNQYGTLRLSPEAQETCRKTALNVTIGMVIGLVAAGVSLAVYLATAQNVANTKPEDDPEEDEFERQVRQLVEAWQKLSEDEYWDAMADWVRTNNPSWYRQRYAATYASTVAKDETSGADLDAAAQLIVDTWNRRKPDAVPIYVNLKTATLKDVPLTRKEKLLGLVKAINIISPPVQG